MAVVDTYTFGALRFQILKATSRCAQHPTITINAPAGTVIVGGGAFVDWDGDICPPPQRGNLLTAMYPNDTGTVWTVASKDHIHVSRAMITAYCIVAQLKEGHPIRAADYNVVSKTSHSAPHPNTEVDLPHGFTVVGGGAKANWTGLGSLLTASHPNHRLNGWVGSAKDHDKSDPSTITVWAIGLREAFLRRHRMSVRSFDKTSSPAANHPSITFNVPRFYLTCPGARVNWHGYGNLLTACYPKDRNTVIAKAKDHIVADPATITAYAVGFQRDGHLDD